MSYSFQLRAATKALAKLAVAEKLDEIAAQQKCHERDKAQAVAAAGAFIDLVDEDETREIAVNMNGSLSGTWEGSDVTAISNAAVNVSVGLATRPTE